jgi:hypothetical protein
MAWGLGYTQMKDVLSKKEGRQPQEQPSL